MISPIEQLIKAARGEEVTLLIPTGGGATAYVPSGPDYVPPAPARYKVRCIWSDGYNEGMANGETAVALIAASGLPEGAVPSKFQIERRNLTRTVVRIRERVYMGKIDGYDLFLAA